jgi:hypothetical protein
VAIFEARQVEQACTVWLALSWRYDPCELAAQAAARMPPRAPQLNPVDPYVMDDEYDPCDDFQ